MGDYIHVIWPRINGRRDGSTNMFPNHVPYFFPQLFLTPVSSVNSQVPVHSAGVLEADVKKIPLCLSPVLYGIWVVRVSHIQCFPNPPHNCPTCTLWKATPEGWGWVQRSKNLYPNPFLSIPRPPGVFFLEMQDRKFPLHKLLSAGAMYGYNLLPLTMNFPLHPTSSVEDNPTIALQ